MILNSIYLFYLTSFRDYKKYWLKTILSLVGLVLSICLITTVQIYVDTIDHHLNKPDLLSQIYPSSYLTHQRGYLKNSDISNIISQTHFSHGYPYANIAKEVFLDNKAYFSTIIGLDLLYVASFLPESESPLEGDSIFFISDNQSFQDQESIVVEIDSKQVNVMALYDPAQVVPLMVMDISTFQHLFKTDMVDRFYVESYQLKQFNKQLFPDFNVFLEEPPPQQLSQAFFINLKFIGAFSIIISSLLVYLFFRFIQKHRQSTDMLLVNLGISNYTKRLMRLIESLFFILITTILGVGLGIVLSQLGLDILATTMNTLYYAMSIQYVILKPSVFFLGFIVSIVSVLFATSSWIQWFEKQVIQLSNYWKWSISFVAIFCSIYLIYFSSTSQLVAYQSMAGLIVLVFFICLMLISALSSFFSWQRNTQFMMIKMASYYIKRELILSTMMVMAIALACGLFISMTLFINSFQFAVAEWIEKSTQSDLYIQSKYNTIPTPVALNDKDVELLISHPGTISWDSISRDNVLINNHSVILRGVQYNDLLKVLQFVKVLDNKHLNVLSKKDILISESAAKKLDLTVGDRIDIPTPTGVFVGTVVGIYIDYASEHGVITMSMKLMKELYQEQFFYHGMALNVNSAFQDDILNDFDHLLIQTNIQLQQYVIKMFKQTFGITWVLASISGIIALFVLVNMLSVLTIDRKQEMIQLFTMGAQSNHLRQLIFSHAFWIGLVSLVMSVVVGASLALIILKQLTPAYFGWVIPIQLTLEPIFYLLGVMVCVIVVTSYIAYRYVWGQVTNNDYVYESIKTHYFSR